MYGYGASLLYLSGKKKAKAKTSGGRRWSAADAQNYSQVHVMASDKHIGITADDKVVTAKKGEKTSGEDEILVPLASLTVWSTSGTTISPVNKDLPCFINEEKIKGETNLLPGCTIEVGDKQLEFNDGPMLKPRRCLPPTPGVPIMPQPPEKPHRHSISLGETLEPATGPPVLRTRPLSLRKPPPLPNDWAVIELPSTDAELLKKTRRPEELASLAASYVTKHLHLHTDCRINAELADQIFSAMLEIAHHRRNILQRFLTDLIEEQANGSSDDPPPEPSHGAIILLLREILRQFLDPQSLVLVSLVMVRAMSHVHGATQLLVECELSSAILGTMAALKSAATIQQYCLDILAKIALFQPLCSQKAPLRESATDLICMALNTHPKSVTIAQSACRALANLATTLYSLVSNTLDTGNQVISDELESFVNGLLLVLDYLFSKSQPAVQMALKCHGHDLTVQTDSRRFFFIAGKLEQLKQRKEQWLTRTTIKQPPPPLPSRSHASPEKSPTEEQREDSPPLGIMKRSRSFENLRRPEREVTFDHGESVESSPASSSSSSSPSPPHRRDDYEDPVQILSQRRIPMPQLPESSPDTPSAKRTVMISHADHDSSYSEVVIGRRPDAEGSDCPFIQPTEYENWDLLRGVLRKKSGLKDHQYSAADITFMTRLAKTQVVALVCALAVQGEVREALSLVEMPICKVVFTTEVPPGVHDFVERQYSTTETLMDVDPGLMVSIIDAVRYKSLSYEMAQKCVLGVVRALDDQQQPRVVAVTVEFLVSTITNRPLAPAMTVPSFVEEVCQELERARKVSQNAGALNSLLAEITLCSNKPTP